MRAASRGIPLRRLVWRLGTRGDLVGVDLEQEAGLHRGFGSRGALATPIGRARIEPVKDIVRKRVRGAEHFQHAVGIDAGMAGARYFDLRQPDAALRDAERVALELGRVADED